MIATGIQSWFYKHIAKPIFFKQDPEKVHDRVLGVGKVLGGSTLSKAVVGAVMRYKNPILVQEIRGVRFPNPVGLAAGFDKNAELTELLPDVGFGFEEIGSITGEYCEGNPKPRLWRHPELQSLRVYYGLKNDGCEAISARLKDREFEIPIGVSVAKTNCAATVETGAAISDYVKAYIAFKDIGSYDTINISCPNAHGGQPFTDVARLSELLVALNEKRNDKPMFLKLSPDLDLERLHEIATVAKESRVDGLVVSNLTKKHDFGDGGLSGKSVEPHALGHLQYLAKEFKNDFVLISCGGIFSAKDTYERIKNGASLVQLATGMIFEGPQLIGEINRDLAKMIKDDGFSNISDAIGADVWR
ncbi:quinone-dependent dihydroorotate dehydrogenase [Candidatus Uhrbacteria bacterium]|jgi:dihydroorotate dehydrogenase|nr:quinone-dependent dihydroorotate dehydrogenase [Candidatus Uhrbacteria bacterium]